MKYIFDLDDVLFNNTKQFKEHMYVCLEEAGVARARAEDYYNTVRKNKFSLRVFIKNVFAFENIAGDPNGLYEKIMGKCPEFVNAQLLEAVRRVGVENCYIVTSGDEEFQREKIKRSGIGDLFPNERVRVASTSKNEPGKKEAIEAIMNQEQNKGKQFVYFDDKHELLEELKDIPGLEVIHYRREFADLMEKKDDGPASELKKLR